MGSTAIMTLTEEEEVTNVANFVQKRMSEKGADEIVIPYDDLKTLILHDESNFSNSINRIKHVHAKPLEKKFLLKAVRKGHEYVFKKLMQNTSQDQVQEISNGKFNAFEIPYIANRKLRFVKRAVERGNFPLLVGPKGCGKSRTAEEVAKSLGLEYVRIALGEIREPADLIGTKEIVSENGCSVTRFIPGLLTEAAMKGWVAILDEFDSVMPSVSLALNKVLEGGNTIMLPMESGVHKIEVHKNFRVICTANTWGGGDSTGYYAGTTIQNRATLDRLGPKIDFDYDVKIERMILKPFLPAAILDAFFNTTAKNPVKQGLIIKIRDSAEIDDTIGMRSLIRFAQDYQDFGWHIASHFLLNDIAEDYRDAVKSMVVTQLGQEFTPSDNDNDPEEADYITDEMRRFVKGAGF